MALPYLWFRAKLILGRAFLLVGVLAWLIGTPVMLVARAGHDVCAASHGPSWMALVECGVGGPLLVVTGMALVRSRRGMLVWSVLAAVTFVGLSLAGLVGGDPDGGVTAVGAVAERSC
jgi:hypothetical protein